MTILTGSTATGQLFLRGPMSDHNGKKVFMVVGVIGVDEDEAAMIQGESQYTIMNLLLTNPEDMSEQSIGMNADNLLTSPIWRI
ncbi:hypothetical protein D3C71_1358890 [compost metagenome]